MKALSLTISAVCLSALLAPATASYPFVVYQKSTGNEVPVEVTRPVSFGEAFADYKELSQGKTNMVVFVKEGLQSVSLASNSNSLGFVSSRILGNSHVFTNVQGGFVQTEFEAGVGAHQSYRIDSVEQESEVAAQIASDLRATNSLFKLSLVTISAALPVSELDNVVRLVEQQVEKVDGNSLYVLAGSKSDFAGALILAEVGQEDPVVVDTTPGIVKYLLPNALIGILFALFILSILIFGFLTLLQVQTPYYFPLESIDFGKIEK
jgi:hypothetical protein